LRTTIPDAERLKREHGCAVPSIGENEEVCEIAGMGSRQPRTISQTVLTDIVQPRAEEIVHLVRNEIRTAGYEQQVGAGVVVTGGGAMLRGLIELAEDILDMPVRKGQNPHSLDNGTRNLTPNLPKLMGPEFATVTGLVLYGDRRGKTHDFHENSSTGLKKFVAKFRSFL